MKILFLTPRGSKNNLGGVEGHVRILREELVKRGHQVKELSLDEIDVLNKNRLPRAAGVGSRNDEFLSKGRALGYKFKAWGYLWEKRDLFRWADVIHVHDVFWWVMPFAMMNKGLALLQDCHVPLKAGLAMTKTLVFVTFHGWEGVCPPTRSAVWQKRLAQKLSQGTIGVGNFFKKWYGITPNKVVYGVLDSDCHVPLSGTRNDGLTRVAFLGRMEEVNGIEVVIEAIKKIIANDANQIKRMNANKRIGFKFIFVGDGSYRKQAEKFGKVTGMVKNPQKYLVSADLVIASSYMSILEAAAIGKPIIAVANSELKMDYLKGHPLRKHIVVCKNSRELARRIASLQFRKDAILAARDWAIKQTPERLADIYEELWVVK